MHKLTGCLIKPVLEDVKEDIGKLIEFQCPYLPIYIDYSGDVYKYLAKGRIGHFYEYLCPTSEVSKEEVFTIEPLCVATVEFKKILTLEEET